MRITVTYLLIFIINLIIIITIAIITINIISTFTVTICIMVVKNIIFMFKRQSSGGTPKYILLKYTQKQRQKLGVCLRFCYQLNYLRNK